MDPNEGGLLVVTDSSLGNVTASGACKASPLEKVCSQSCYFVLLADKQLMNGETGHFNILDMRSHRIPRVCRSSYVAETLGAQEAFDVGQLCRGFLASIRGPPLHGKETDKSLNSVALTVVVDAKDVHDKANSDTSSFGSQKSLAFTIAWLRGVLRRTSTQNMWADAGTKEMELDHVRQIMDCGTWSVTYSPEFVKQVSKGKRVPPPIPRDARLALLGEPLRGDDPLLGHLMKLGDQRGWHRLDDVGVNVADHAKSYRTPEPRFSSAEYPLRSTFCRVELPSGQVQWRRLEKDLAYTELANQHGLLSERAAVLVTFFSRRPGQS